MKRLFSHFRPARSLILLLAAAGSAASPPAAEPLSAAAAREAAERSVRALGLQTELPRPKAPLPDDDPGPDWRFSPYWANILLYGSLLALALIAFLILRGSLWSDSRAWGREAGQAAEGGGGPAAAGPPALLAEADRLADEGKYAEAAHALLLRGLEEVRLRLEASLAASLTSREILARVALLPEGREALAGMVALVEKSRFGTHRPGREEYLDCRRSHLALLAALGRRGGP